MLLLSVLSYLSYASHFPLTPILNIKAFLGIILAALSLHYVTGNEIIH